MEYLFLELLRCGLWGYAPKICLFEKEPRIDWATIHRFAKQQSVTALVFDGIMKLPLYLQPPRLILLQWVGEVNAIEMQNDKLNHKVIELNSLYEDFNLSPILLKGQGIATLYNEPKHRTCGDIDLYSSPNEIQLINSILESLNGSTGYHYGSHFTFQVEGVTIENHHTLTRLFNPIANYKLQKILHSHISEFNYCVICNNKVRIPSCQMNVLYIFLHIAKHFFIEGIGLRQICDWGRLLFSCYNEYDKNRLKKELELLGLTKLACVFGALLIECLGLQKEMFPLEITNTHRKYVPFLFEEILSSGNFGRVRNLKGKAPANKFLRKIYNFRNICYRSFRIIRLCPSEAICLPGKIFIESISNKSYLL